MKQPKDGKLLDDHEANHLVEGVLHEFSGLMTRVENCIGGKGYHLHEAIVDAVYRGVKDGTREFMENSK